MKYLYADPVAKLLAPATELVLDICQDELGLTNVNIPLRMGALGRFTGAATKSFLDFNPPHIAMMLGHSVVKLFLFNNRPGILAEALCHESIHVSQLVSGRLQETEDHIVWDGKTWDLSAVDSTLRTMGNNIRMTTDAEREAYNAYRHFPWEKEAYSRGTALLLKVVERLNSGKKKEAA